MRAVSGSRYKPQPDQEHGWENFRNRSSQGAESVRHNAEPEQQYGYQKRENRSSKATQCVLDSEGQRLNQRRSMQDSPGSEREYDCEARGNTSSNHTESVLHSDCQRRSARYSPDGIVGVGEQGLFKKSSDQSTRDSSGESSSTEVSGPNGRDYHRKPSSYCDDHTSGSKRPSQKADLTRPSHKKSNRDDDLHSERSHESTLVQVGNEWQKARQVTSNSLQRPTIGERNTTFSQLQNSLPEIALSPLTDDFDMEKLFGVKLLAVDLDKTLYPNGMGNATTDPKPEAREELDKNIEGFLMFIADGGVAIPVTGHSPAMTQRKFDRSKHKWEVKDHPGVFHNGALVLGVGGVIEYSASIPKIVMRAIQKWATGCDGWFDFEGYRYPFAVNVLTKSKLLDFRTISTTSKQIADDWAGMQFMSNEFVGPDFDWERFPAYQVNLLLESKDDMLEKYPALGKDTANNINRIQRALFDKLQGVIGKLSDVGCEGKHVLVPWCETNIVVSGVNKGESLNRFIHAKSVKEKIGIVNVGRDVIVAGDAANDLSMFLEWPQVKDFNGETLEKTERPPIRIIMPDADDEKLTKESNLKNKVFEVLAILSHGPGRPLKALSQLQARDPRGFLHCSMSEISEVSDCNEEPRRKSSSKNQKIPSTACSRYSHVPALAIPQTQEGLRFGGFEYSMFQYALDGSIHVSLDLRESYQREVANDFVWGFDEQGAYIKRYKNAIEDRLSDIVRVGRRLRSINSQDMNGLKRSEIEAAWCDAQKDGGMLVLVLNE